MKTSIKKIQHGYVLITSLIFMMILTLIAVTAMDMTTMELRMSSNTTLKYRSLESSEGLRTIAGNLIDAHTYHRGWPAAYGGAIADDIFNVDIPAGLSIRDDSGSPALMYLDNGVGESVFTTGSLVTDLTYQVDENGDGDYDDDRDTNSTVSVYKLNTITTPGSGTCQVCGYEGSGKSGAGGGTIVYFDLRSIGTSAGSANTTTVAEYRHVVRN